MATRGAESSLPTSINAPVKPEPIKSSSVHRKIEDVDIHKKVKEVHTYEMGLPHHVVEDEESNLSSVSSRTYALQQETTFQPASPSKLFPKPGSGGRVGTVVMSMMWSIYIPSVLFGLSDAVILSTIPLLARSLHCSDTMVGILCSARHLGKMLADVPAGNFHGESGAESAMRLGLFGISVLAVFAWISTGIYSLFAALLLSGCCEALFTVSRETYMRNHILNRHRGRAISLVAGINRITRSLGPVVGGWLSEYMGTAATMLLRAVLGMLGALLMVNNSIPEAPSTALLGHASRSKKHSFRDACFAMYLFRAELFTGGVAAFLLMVTRRARDVVIPMKGDDIDATPADIGYAFAAGYVVDSLLFLPVGWAMDTYGRKFAGVPSFVVLASGLVLIPFVSSRTGLIAASILMGLGNGLSSGLSQTLGSDLSPSGSRTGSFMGAWSLMTDFGAFIGPIVLGSISEARGLAVSSFACALIGLVGACWLCMRA